MTLEEVFLLYKRAEDVSNPFDVAPDLEYVIYPEEENYAWRFVSLPITAVGADLSLSPTPGCTEEDEDKRFEVIRTWMNERGITQALKECPPIARMTDEFGLDLVDGRHRLALAHNYGINTVQMLVGAAPGWEPKPKIGFSTTKFSL